MIDFSLKLNSPIWVQTLMKGIKHNAGLLMYCFCESDKALEAGGERIFPHVFVHKCCEIEVADV